MHILKKLLLFITAFILTLQTTQYSTYASSIDAQNPVKVAVFLNNFHEIRFYSHVKENLEKIQKENENKVEFTFFDSKGNQGTQNDDISNTLNNESFDLFVITPVSRDVEQSKNTISRIIINKIPLVILAPPDPSMVKHLQGSPSVIIGGDDKQSGVLQGELISNTWNTNKESLDKNKDNIMEYVMIQGPSNDPATLARSKYSIQTVNDSGIKTQELFSICCNWEYECAKTNMESIFLKLNNKIEAIISNNDSMAIGAIEALQKYGYNSGDKSKYIPVFGINSLPESEKLISQGAMAGTVIQDPFEYANTVYKVGMNLVSGIDPTSGTNYKFDETGKIIRIPYYKYTNSQ